LAIAKRTPEKAWKKKKKGSPGKKGGRPRSLRYVGGGSVTEEKKMGEGGYSKSNPPTERPFKKPAKRGREKGGSKKKDDQGSPLVQKEALAG